MKIIDAHSHIDYITHRIQTDVVGTVVCTIDEFEWGVLINMMRHSDKIYGAFGIHPWRAQFVDSGFYLRLKSLLKTNRSLMVGEIGLDKFKPNMDKQIDVFTKQFDIAVELQRRVVLHCVGAWDKILHILKSYSKSKLPTIIVHGFDDSLQIMQNLLDNYDVVFSLGKNSVYGKNCRIEQIPDDKILVETDGKKDVFLIDLINEISKIKTNSNMADIIYKNTLKVLQNG